MANDRVTDVRHVDPEGRAACELLKGIGRKVSNCVFYLYAETKKEAGKTRRNTRN